MERLFESDERLIDESSNLLFPINPQVVFTKIRSDERADLRELFTINPTSPIFSEEISKIELETLLSSHKSELTENQVNVIRTLIFPEIKIENRSPINKDEDLDNSIKALDVEQERFAKRIPLGHYLLSGVPGSGKTVVLLTRAIHLIRQNPDWKTLILTYNRSLKDRLQSRMSSMLEDLSFYEKDKLPNIEVMTFHELALNLANIPIPNRAGGTFWKDILPKVAFENARPIYDAILIDEYQDFYNNWIKVCIKSLKKYQLDDGKEVVNLFMAGDRLQSIYNPKEINWKQDIGLSMQGRSKLLKSSYRAGKEHLSLAIEYLLTDESLKKEVEKFYDGSGNIEYQNERANNSINFIEGGLYSVAEEVSNLIENGYKANEILILTNTRREIDEIYHLLPLNIREDFINSKDIIEGYGIITTYYSSKGLESRVVILTNIDNVSNPKVVYVGMTRASERLIIHSSNPSFGEVTQKLKSLANYK